MCYKRRFIITNKFKTESISLEQYIKTNNNSNIIIPVDYKVSKHEEELRVARLLKDKIGGIIHMLNESNVDGEKMPDYLWDSKLWELKSISTKESIDRQVRKAIKQIWNNPGGIVLDIKKRWIEEDEIVDIVFNRINRSYHEIDTIEIILIKNSNILKIIRLNK